MAHTEEQATCIAMARKIIDKVNSSLAMDQDVRKMGLCEARFDMDESAPTDPFKFTLYVSFNIGYPQKDSEELKIITRTIHIDLSVFRDDSGEYVFTIENNKYPQRMLETHFDGNDIVEPVYPEEIKQLLLKRLYNSEFD